MLHQQMRLVAQSMQSQIDAEDILAHPFKQERAVADPGFKGAVWVEAGNSHAKVLKDEFSTRVEKEFFYSHIRN